MPSDEYMHQYTKPTIFQIMARRLFVISQYLNQCRVIFYWIIAANVSATCIKLQNVRTQENTFENIACKMAIGQSVDLS